MARQARNTLHSNLVFVTQYCDGQLYRDDTDRIFFLDILKKVQTNFNCHILAFCCNENDRFQIIIDTQGANISKIIQSLTIAYSMYRKSDTKLFTQRFKAKAILSEVQLKQIIQSIQKERNEYSACCMMSETMAKYDWMKPYNPIVFIQAKPNKRKLDIDELQLMLSTRLAKENLDLNQFNKDKLRRNEWIKEIRQKYDCSLNCLAIVLGLSESSISKIINTVGQNS